MADTVRYLMEAMVPELEDMVARGYFTRDEARSIAARRQGFEYKLKRKAPLLADYLAYIAYEADLDELRRARRAAAADAGHAAAAGPPGLADRAGARRIHFIYARATRKWRGDLGLWRAWLAHCAATGASRRGSRVAAAALALHSRQPALWAAAAEWEFGGSGARARARGGGGNPAAARALLQRGLRANPESDALWADYLRLELAYAATLRARRAVLLGEVGGGREGGGGGGAPPPAKRGRTAAAAAAAADAASDDDDESDGADTSGDDDVGTLEVEEGGVAGGGGAAGPPTPGAADADDPSEAATRRVLDGGVAALVAKSAVCARPASLALRLALLDALHSPDVVEAGLPGAAEAAEGLYASLTADFPGEAGAWDAAARRHVGPYAPPVHAGGAAKKPAARRRGSGAGTTTALPPAEAAAAAVFDAGVASNPSSSALWDAYAAFLAERAAAVATAGTGGAKARGGAAPAAASALTDALLSVYARAAAAGAASDTALLAWPRAALAAGRVGDALDGAAAATAASPTCAAAWKQRLVLEGTAARAGGGGDAAARLLAVALDAARAVPLAEAGPVWEAAFAAVAPPLGDAAAVAALADALVAALGASARPKGPVEGGLGAAAAAAVTAVSSAFGPAARRDLIARIRATGPPPGAAFYAAALQAEVEERGDALPRPALRALFEEAVASYGDACPGLWLRYAAWARSVGGKGGGDLYWRATKALEGESELAAFTAGWAEVMAGGGGGV